MEGIYPDLAAKGEGRPAAGTAAAAARLSSGRAGGAFGRALIGVSGRFGGGWQNDR
jgi:hypothetical protein